MKLQPGDSGYHRMAWADALLEACNHADLTIKVPADFPLFAARLYENTRGSDRSGPEPASVEARRTLGVPEEAQVSRRNALVILTAALFAFAAAALALLGAMGE